MSTFRSGWLDDDDLLFEELKDAVAAAGDTPPDMVRAAQGAFTWRNIDADLMALSYDSSVDETASLRAGPDAGRSVAFVGEEVGVELEIDRDGLMGQLIPGRECRCVLARATGTTFETRTTADGFFQVRGLPSGPMRLEFHDGGPKLVTDWISV